MADIRILQSLVSEWVRGDRDRDAICHELNGLLCEGLWCEAFMDFIDEPPVGGSYDEALETSATFLGLDWPSGPDQAAWLILSGHCERLQRNEVSPSEWALAVRSLLHGCELPGPVKTLVNLAVWLDDVYDWGTTADITIAESDCQGAAETWTLGQASKWKSLGLEWDV